MVNYLLSCANGHKTTIRINAKDADGLCTVITGKSLLIQGDCMLGKCAVCGAVMDCTYNYDSPKVGQVVDPDAVHEATKQGFEGR